MRHLCHAQQAASPGETARLAPRARRARGGGRSPGRAPARRGGRSARSAVRLGVQVRNASGRLRSVLECVSLAAQTVLPRGRGVKGLAGICASPSIRALARCE